MRFPVALLLSCLALSLAVPATAGGYRGHRGHHRHHGHHGHHGHHYDHHDYDDYVYVLGALGAGVLIYTAGRIHGARAADRGRSTAPVAYPAHRQGQEEQARDRYECHRWAVSEARFDPSRERRGDVELYDRAVSACLEARGYVVR